MHVLVIIVSDTHSVLDARIASLARMSDFAVHAGDIGSLQVLHALKPRQGVVAVRGNNDTPDKWPAGEQDALATLPFETRLELPGGYLQVLHGDRAGRPQGLHARLRMRYADARAIVYGHSHRLVCDCAQLPWVLNPGAAGRQRTYGGPSCLVLRASARQWDVEARRFDPLPAHPAPMKNKRI
ncbi:MAG: metallophosphoesterase family protein [Gammaproteobacteria bacterium]